MKPVGHLRIVGGAGVMNRERVDGNGVGLGDSFWPRCLVLAVQRMQMHKGTRDTLINGSSSRTTVNSISRFVPRLLYDDLNFQMTNFSNLIISELE